MLKTNLRKGVYHFKFPFIGYHSDFNSCHVELHVGKDTGLNVGTTNLFTVIITQEENGGHVEQFIEGICTDLKLWLEQHLSQRIEPDTICWYQVIPYYNNGIWKSVKMKWHTTELCFHSPQWDELDPLNSKVAEG